MQDQITELTEAQAQLLQGAFQQPLQEIQDEQGEQIIHLEQVSMAVPQAAVSSTPATPARPPKSKQAEVKPPVGKVNQ